MKTAKGTFLTTTRLEAFYATWEAFMVMAVRQRHRLREIDLASVWPPRRGVCYITFTSNQWDALLSAAYATGFVLIEMNDAEQPVRAYQRASQ